MLEFHTWSYIRVRACVYIWLAYDHAEFSPIVSILVRLCDNVISIAEFTSEMGYDHE